MFESTEADGCILYIGYLCGWTNLREQCRLTYEVQYFMVVTATSGSAMGLLPRGSAGKLL